MMIRNRRGTERLRLEHVGSSAAHAHDCTVCGEASGAPKPDARAAPGDKCRETVQRSQDTPSQTWGRSSVAGGAQAQDPPAWRTRCGVLPVTAHQAARTRRATTSRPCSGCGRNDRMDTAATRSLVQEFLTVRAAGDADAIAALLTDDAVWAMPSSLRPDPFSGRDAVAKALAGGVSGTMFDPATIRRDVHKMIVEGDTAVVLQRLQAVTRQGKDYGNEYCWVYTCRDGKIARLDEHADTLYAARVFGIVQS